MGNQIFKDRRGNKKKRKEAIRQLKPLRYLIICEGKKTEPLYFESIKNRINDKYGNKITIGNIDCSRFLIEGIGMNTKSLVNYTMKLRSNASIPYGNVWCVFDKDSFSDNDFNSAIKMCEDNDMNAAWSNEAIELWFILHFEYLNTAIDRKMYIKKLNTYFKKYNINSCKYEKNYKDIYKFLIEYGDLDFAINNAKKLEKQFYDNITFSSMNPVTKVYKLVEELIEYLGKT